MNSAESAKLLAASGGDTVKLFDISVEPQDPCVLTYSPSPGLRVNSVKWNHNNLVLASAGEDSRISLWRKNGQSLWTVPAKSSRGEIIENKRCVKWLKGHTDTITGTLMDRLLFIVQSTHVVAKSLIVFYLDCMHLLVTAGDDGSIHLWDTTGRNPKKFPCSFSTKKIFKLCGSLLISFSCLCSECYNDQIASHFFYIATFCVTQERFLAEAAFSTDLWRLFFHHPMNSLTGSHHFLYSFMRRLFFSLRFTDEWIDFGSWDTSFKLSLVMQNSCKESLHPLWINIKALDLPALKETPLRSSLLTGGTLAKRFGVFQRKAPTITNPILTGESNSSLKQ
ncbi:UNVERIFIED_CONTAM: protein NEDD1, partial [Sesamum calycinum]